jgi:hypothetical protein
VNQGDVGIQMTSWQFLLSQPVLGLLPSAAAASAAEVVIIINVCAAQKNVFITLNYRKEKKACSPFLNVLNICIKVIL